ncbi:SpoIIE family protein phosphatase [Streptomyces fagopyri]|uniref:protein-serine/threonine phosphatase n=1 Tax=Streptomyces fagopyri TaxID=2662397 RepID=A0A5Q0L7A1_9ACTN|nr:SpoIIE family protein phosphatase [Streptomyces fagopyri]QFZ72975.1 SpoIIE family protein phosphatase [Streptomyces fagopyri]
MHNSGDIPPAAGSGLELLDPYLSQIVLETGASIGHVYLLTANETELRLSVMSGISREIIAPWARVGLDHPIPVSDAVRERRLVWIGGQEEMALRYPRAALVLPYPFAVVAAPIATGTTTWGGLVLLWPGSHPPRLALRERDAVQTWSDRLGLLLQQASDRGHPVLPGPEPRMLPGSSTRTTGAAEAQAAADFTERLPDGCCGLNMTGHIAYLTTAAACLVGAERSALLGARPCDALPWLDKLVFEDRYRAAVVSGRPTSFTALCPPDRQLSFHLYPDASGLSIRITPAPSPHGSEFPEPHPSASVTPGRTAGLYHLLHLAAALTEAVGVQDVVDQAADQLLDAFNAQGLVLFVAANDRLRVIGHRGYAAEAIDRVDGAPLSGPPTSSAPVPPTPPALALTAGVPSFFGSRDEMRRAYPETFRLTDKAAWAFLPLIASGRPVGCWTLSYDRPHPFPPEERAILTSTAGLLAQALDRAGVYDDEHHLVHRLQTALLPRALPDIAGLDVAARYLPSTRGIDIGGDFYDLIRLGPTTVAATIGDVQGHNADAAALMGQVRTAVHAAAGAPPGDVLARVNRLLTDLDPGLFTSCLYAHLDLTHHRVRMATAGHPPPLLRHPDGLTEVLSLSPGLLLGIDSTSDYPTTEIQLPPGAVLALYTDGLVEAPGADIDETTAQLAVRLSEARHHTMDALADTLVHHAQQPSRQNDDIALLLISPRPD